eukprot:4083689-Karenia_brevis.AAC.1
MQLVLTQNRDKDNDFVNGMEVKVDKWDPRGDGGVLRVTTKSGVPLVVTKWTDVEHGDVKYCLLYTSDAADDM